jgi:hypothetical protein
MRIRKAVALSAVGLLVVALCGCDQFLPEPLSFTMVDGRPIIRVCLPVTVSYVEIDTFDEDARPPYFEEDAIPIWWAEGDVFMDAGTEFVLGAAPDGFTVVLDDVASAPDYLDGTFSVHMGVEHGNGSSWEASSFFDSATFEEGVWLDSQGDPLEMPCTRPDCDPGWACHNEWPVPSGAPTRVQPTLTPSP